MRDSFEREDQTAARPGGRIPGTPGHPAFTISSAECAPLPVLIAVPHAGRAYPAPLLRSLRDPAGAAARLEDRYADRLGRAVAAQTGAPLLVAHAPRAMIDLNRAPDDIDWQMFARAERPGDHAGQASRRARSGLGLIPRRVPGIGELWRRSHRRDELEARIADIHAPYHATLAETLAALRERWGVAVLLDLHSMPPIEPRPGMTPPELVIGDRFGITAHGALVAAAFSALSAQRVAAAHNRPYAGGYTLERHAEPRAGLHTIQIEVDRAAYLDSQMDGPGRGFDRMVAVLAALTRRIAAEANALARHPGDKGWAQAAE